ncbi:abnormal spindle-like microcephaly-associated homolog [Lecanosticta acicola]|uniref:Abnormal spindle-like microcephaly-associated homolog n=1 Tax=Lecanosticta acicola TaxID=111012 RepID=A0AAI8YXR8_9PEZI|nr:abnormal spindle-like microcephaly-associated homolog [Lecanosticta acicola]
MSRTSLPTPCPAFGSRHFSSLPAFDISDDTAQIDYTRAFDSSLRGPQPRRSSALYGKMARKAPVAVFEEVREDEVLDQYAPKGPVQGKTLLSKPARKMAVGSTVRSDVAETEARGGLKEIGQVRAQTSDLKGGPSIPMVERKVAEGSMASNRRGSLAHGGMAGGIKKDPRRRTIFVPEDTTVLTIHPGGHTTRLDDTFQLSSFDVPPIPQEEMQIAEEDSQLQKPLRRLRRSLAAAPRRGPLQPIQGIDNVDGFDVCGANTGKENQPPRAEKKFKPITSVKPDSPVHHNAVQRSRLLAPTAASQARQNAVPRNPVPLTKALATKPAHHMANSRLSTFSPRAATPPKARPLTSREPQNLTKPRHSGSPQQRSSPNRPGRTSAETSQKQELRRMMAKRRNEMQATKVKHYPSLTEDLAHLSLYEDDWLSQQEVALTEVVNEIFKAVETRPRSSSKSVRQSMIDIYHQPDVAIMHKRLQASLVYGALSKPKGTSATSDLRHDIGLRKRFVNLWLESYNQEVLRAAAEVVVGKQIPRRNSASQYSIEESERILDPVTDRRDLIAFLETFLVHVSDLDLAESLGYGEAQSLETMRWRKTMERSFMLIWLLDQAKTSELVSVTLFKSRSKHKSSASLLRTLSAMLLPAVGDIVRTVKQLDYQVSHGQDPLDEVAYRIENLAVDLRDGILLTHLVETLLYSRQADHGMAGDDNATVTVTLPDAAIIQSDYYTPDNFRNTRMLSQHLRMPCLGHAQQAFNVQVALSALACWDVDAANVVGDVTADDIVHGHREKTLSLLWSLVSVYGLDHLIDWKELAVDTQHASAAANTLNEASMRHDHATHLQNWAAAHFPGVKNLTTSFSDGKAYASILEHFSAHLPPRSASERTSTSTTALESQLLSLGCSAAFTRQLTSTIGAIPSRETTLSNLAFLASRLLPLSKQHHAAMRIQRWYRHQRMPRMISQRVALMRMARDCALVVQTQQKIYKAATTLQGAWRGVIARRVERLEGDVQAFQVLARGWRVRGRMNGQGGGRVMGGW